MNAPEFHYRTLAHASEAIVREKGSRFIGIARCIDSEEKAGLFLDDVKSLHPKARHHCYAWRIGHPDIQERANDDGEPSGTAGRPILGQLIKTNVTNVMIIVVRYFGGTLLGTSGLIQAYKTCAEAVLDNALIIRITEKQTWQIEIEYAIVHLFEEWAPRFHYDILEREHVKTRMIYKVEIEKENAWNARRELVAKLLGIYPEEVEEAILEYDQFAMKQLQ